MKSSLFRINSLSHYMELTQAAQKISSGMCDRKIRLALLSDANSEQLLPLLKVFFAQNRLDADFYCTSIGAYEVEVLNPESELYQFGADGILILNTLQALRTGYYLAGSKEQYEEYISNKTVALWESLQKQSTARIIQANFADPIERLFGNFDSKVPWSLSSLVHSLNHKLLQRLRDSTDVLLFDVNALASLVGREQWFDETLWHHSKTMCSLKFLPAVAKGLGDICMASFVRTTKCVVLDLDNTLWGGVIGDDGLAGIELSPEGEGAAYLEFQSYLLELKNRGIILAVSSKNNHETALEVFRKHPQMRLKEDDITVFAVNWESKAQNIQMIKETLNIGFDAMVFVDDSKYERELVRQFIPDIIVPELSDNPANYVSDISMLNLFETTSFTLEDRNRPEMYAKEVRRIELGKSMDSVDEFLKTLQMEAVVSQFKLDQVERIAQLMNRSNQFNLTTKRYSVSDCKEMITNQDYHTISISLKDKFGDYGLISTIILKMQNEEMHIDQWLMSCRVLSRGVEQIAMNYIIDLAHSRKVKKIVGTYIPTSKNGMVKSFYQQFNFTMTAQNSDTTQWELTQDQFVLQNHYIRMNVLP